MQIPAIGAAAEVSAAKDSVPAQGKAATVKSPFSGLLEGVMHQLSDKNQKGEDDQAQEESSGMEVLLNAWMPCPESLVMPRKVGSQTESSGDDTAETLWEAAAPEAVVGAGTTPENGMSTEKPVEVPEEILPGEETEGSVETITVQNGKSLKKEGISMPEEVGKPTGQNRTPEGLQQTGNSAGAPAERDGVRRVESAGRNDAEEAAQFAPGVKAEGEETRAQKGSYLRPDRERGDPEREPAGLKADIVRYSTGAEGPEAALRSEPQQILPGRGEMLKSRPAAEAQNDIVNQVAEKMKVMLGDRRSEISIQLKPESLGRLRIRLTVTDGVLNGRIIVQTHETRGLIQANIAKLQESLEQQGIPVSRFNVNVGGDGGYGQQQFFRDNRHSYRGGQGIAPYRQDEKEEYPLWRGEGTIELLA